MTSYGWHVKKLHLAAVYGNSPGTSTPMHIGHNLHPLRNGKKNKQVYFFVTLFTQFSLTAGSLFYKFKIFVQIFVHSNGLVHDDW